MSTAVDTQQLATVPAPTAGPAPAGYVGRHRADRHEPRGTHHQVADPVSPAYNPLPPGVRQTLAPHHYADRHLPAGVDDRTGLALDPSAVLALTGQPVEPATTGDVLAELRADLTAPAGSPGWWTTASPTDTQEVTP